MIYQINEKILKREINKLYPLKYNRFFWWRKYSPINKPLPPKSPLWDKILNGDFEFSHFYWQAKQAELEINQLHDEMYEIDPSQFSYESKMVRLRREKLLQDFEKDENLKLKELENQFISNFFISPKEYKEEIEEFGDTIKSLYIHCKSKYGKRIVIKSKRGRPKKSL
jgi:hypothetical protein